MIERVFVVDEDVGVRDFLYELISEVGFGVLTVPTGLEALERLKKERPVLIIIEDTPGEFSGIPLAKKIRELDRDIKIIMLGPQPQGQALARHIEEIHIAAYLKKDFQNPEIIKNILLVLKEGSFIKPQDQKKRRRILIVDDEIESREIIGNTLRRRGFDVDTASSGEECIEKVQARFFDIVLLDITMSGMDGLLTLKHIRDINGQIKVVMVTALQNKAILAEANAMGASGTIIKPFNFDTLEHTLLSIFSATP